MLPIGKLPPELLSQFLDSLDLTDPDLVIGPRVGQDAAVLDIGEHYLVAKADPITFATDAVGWYAVCVNSNDIATMGAIPRWFLATLLLPENVAVNAVESIFEQLRVACESFQITLCGGHTEVTHDLHRPIISGFMLGTVEKADLITSAGAQVGDDILLTKGMAIEATSIIAREKADEVERKYGHDWMKRAQDFLYWPGISVLKDAQIACRTGGVHAMHDPTEGGVATAIHEMAHCSGVGVLIEREGLLLVSEAERLCLDYGLDPLGVISSGALLMAVDPGCTGSIIDALSTADIQCSRIGRIVSEHDGMSIVEAGVPEQLPLFVTDEITRIFG